MPEFEDVVRANFKQILLMNRKPNEAMRNNLSNEEYLLIRLQISGVLSTEFGVLLLTTRV